MDLQIVKSVESTSQRPFQNLMEQPFPITSLHCFEQNIISIL